MKNIFYVLHGKKIIAILLAAGYRKNGIEFLTPAACGQQLAYIGRPKGYIITPHLHKPAKRVIRSFSEALFVKRGRVRVDFYSGNKKRIASRIIRAGDVVLFIAGGHGFEFLERSELIEIKQGPFLKRAQAVKFNNDPS